MAEVGQSSRANMRSRTGKSKSKSTQMDPVTRAAMEQDTASFRLINWHDTQEVMTVFGTATGVVLFLLVVFYFVPVAFWIKYKALATLIIYMGWVGSPSDTSAEGRVSVAGMSVTTCVLLCHVCACVPLYFLATRSMAPWWSMAVWVFPYIIHITLRTLHQGKVRVYKYVRDKYVELDNDVRRVFFVKCGDEDSAGWYHYDGSLYANLKSGRYLYVREEDLGHPERPRHSVSYSERNGTRSWHLKALYTTIEYDEMPNGMYKEKSREFVERVLYRAHVTGARSPVPPTSGWECYESDEYRVKGPPPEVEFKEGVLDEISTIAEKQSRVQTQTQRPSGPSAGSS